MSIPNASTQGKVNNKSRTREAETLVSKKGCQWGKKLGLTFAAAICASRPLAIDLGVNIDPPLFGAYQTEPGC